MIFIYYKISKKINKNCQKIRKKNTKLFCWQQKRLCVKGKTFFILVILFSKHPSNSFLFPFFFAYFFSSLKQHSIKKNRAKIVLKLQLVKRFIKKSWKQKRLFFFFSCFFLLLLFSFSSQIDNLSTIFYYRSFEEGVRSLSFISRFLPQLFLHNILLIFPFIDKTFFSVFIENFLPF